MFEKQIQYAPVVPIPIAQQLKDQGELGNYHLLLAHDVVQQPEAYADVYDDPNNFIIMDNSAVELQAPVDYEMLLEAGKIVNANCLVLPDHLLDSNATVTAHLEALDKLEGRWNNDYMALPQGESLGHWVACAKDLLRLQDVKYFGIPRNVKEKLKVSRVIAATVLNMMDTDPDRRYHLFGFSDSLFDDLLTCATGKTTVGKIMGIDSTVPVRMGTNGVGLHPLQNDPGPRGDWWDNPGSMNGLVHQNLEDIRNWVNYNTHIPVM